MLLIRLMMRGMMSVLIARILVAVLAYVSAIFEYIPPLNIPIAYSLVCRSYRGKLFLQQSNIVENAWIDKAVDADSPP
jgi:hypothetical protein